MQRTREEKAAGLMAVAVQCPQIHLILTDNPSDVMTLALAESRRVEITYEVAGYDIWVDGEPLAFDVTVEQAARALQEAAEAHTST